MSGTRLNIDLFIPDMTPNQIASTYPTILQGIKQLKGLARKINDGKPNEEATVKATYHLCRNDENKPCDEIREL
jgi:hypothetical protein